jgi:hypothetical protein
VPAVATRTAMVAASSGRAARPKAATCPDPPAHHRAAAATIPTFRNPAICASSATFAPEVFGVAGAPWGRSP